MHKRIFILLLAVCCLLAGCAKKPDILSVWKEPLTEYNRKGAQFSCPTEWELNYETQGMSYAEAFRPPQDKDVRVWLHTDSNLDMEDGIREGWLEIITEGYTYQKNAGESTVEYLEVDGQPCSVWRNTYTWNDEITQRCGFVFTCDVYTFEIEVDLTGKYTLEDARTLMGKLMETMKFSDTTRE